MLEVSVWGNAKNFMKEVKGMFKEDVEAVLLYRSGGTDGWNIVSDRENCLTVLEDDFVRKFFDLPNIVSEIHVRNLFDMDPTLSRECLVEHVKELGTTRRYCIDCATWDDIGTVCERAVEGECIDSVLACTYNEIKQAVKDSGNYMIDVKIKNSGTEYSCRDRNGNYGAMEAIVYEELVSFARKLVGYDCTINRVVLFADSSGAGRYSLVSEQIAVGIKKNMVVIW